jgi:DinB superfamily
MSSPGAQANSERESLLQLLRRTEALYLAKLENVSPEQAAFKPRPDRWSIAEIAEHVAIAEEFMYKLAADASTSTEESDPRIDERIHRLAADRGRAFPAPEDVCPRGRFASVTESTLAFRGARQRTIEYVEQTLPDLRRLRVMHPTGNIDVYQNLLIGAYHPERHAKQIEEVKSSPGYPK